MSRVVLLLAFLLALPSGAGAQEEQPDAAATPMIPWCDGTALVVPVAWDEPVRVPLPARCLQSATDGHRTAVAGGEAGAFLILHADPHAPTVVLVPTVGVITGVDFDDGALAVTEALTVHRMVLVGPEGDILVPSVTPPPPPEPPVVDAELPLATPPATRTRIGVVHTVRGRRAIATREEGPAPPPEGTLVAAHRGRTKTSVVSGTLRPGRKGSTSVVEVEAVTDDAVILMLGRGDVVRPGAEVLWGGTMGSRTARLAGPTPWRNQLAFVLELAPGLSASTWSPGTHVMGRLRAAWALPIPMRVEVGLEHFSLGFTPDGAVWSGGDVQFTAELDLAPFGIGLSGGYQDLGLSHAGPTVGGYVRGGFRDGLHLELRARFVVGASNNLGGIEGRGVIPFNDLVGLTLEAGGGSDQGYARIGIVVYPFGQGGSGTLILNPSLGMSLMGWTGLGDRGDPWSGTTVNHVGPAATVRVEWRP